MDSAEPNLSEYLAEVRRSRPLIGAAALVGALFGLLLWAAGTEDQGRVATATVAVADIGEPVELLLKTPNRPKLAVAPIVAQFNASGLEASAVAAADVAASVSVAASGDEPNQLITVRVTAPDDDTATAVLKSAIEQVGRARSRAAAAEYAPVAAGAEASKTRAESVLASIDDQLASLPAGGATSDYLTATGLRARADLTDAIQLLTAIETALGAPDGGIVLVGDTSTGPSPSAAPWPVNAVIGAFLGALLASGLVVARRFTSSPTDSRGAVERCGVPCLAITSHDASTAASDGLAPALARHLTGDGLAAVAARHVRPTAIERIRSIAGEHVSFLEDAPPAPDQRVVFVVDRRTPEDELRAMVFTATSAGAIPVGAVLTGVAPADLDRARGR